MAKYSIQNALKKAKAIRSSAEKKAKKLEMRILNKLKTQRLKLWGALSKIDVEIKRISENVGDAPYVAAIVKGKRQRLEGTILEIVTEAGKLSCANIEAHPKMIALYAPHNVPSQAVKLASLVKENKLKKEGKRKQAVYVIEK